MPGLFAPRVRRAVAGAPCAPGPSSGGHEARPGRGPARGRPAGGRARGGGGGGGGGPPGRGRRGGGGGGGRPPLGPPLDDDAAGGSPEPLEREVEPELPTPGSLPPPPLG